MVFFKEAPPQNFGSQTKCWKSVVRWNNKKLPVVQAKCQDKMSGVRQNVLVVYGLSCSKSIPGKWIKKGPRLL